MEDKDFYAEIVKRISPPLKRKTDIQLINIVLYNTIIPVQDMFDDKGIEEIFKESIQGEAYRFIRDNQELYTTPNTLNYGQINAVIQSEKATQLLNTNSFSSQEYEILLNHALYVRKFDLAKLIMGKGINPRTDTAFFMESLANGEDQVKNLEYLSSQNIDLLALGAGKLLFNAVINENYETLSYLIKKAPLDMPIMIKAFKRHIHNKYESKVQYKQYKEDFENIAKQMLPILHLLMEKISLSKFENTLKELKTNEMKEFLTKHYLSVKLNNDLLDPEINKQKIKI